MEPQDKQSDPGLNLPQPTYSSPSGGGAAATPVPSKVDNSQPVPPQLPQDMVPPGKPTVTPDMADDADLIEKEWVVKAKEIVENNRNDPHKLNQEINRMKADYIKKRYNKDIKLKNE